MSRFIIHRARRLFFRATLPSFNVQEVIPSGAALRDTRRIREQLLNL